MGPKPEDITSGFLDEVRQIGRRASEVWRLVPARHKLALGGAAVIMGIAGIAGTAIPLCLGRLIDAVKAGNDRGLSHASLYTLTATYLAFIGAAYLVRESLNVLRRVLVENTCTRIDKDMCVKLVSHLLRVDLATLSHEQVGALHGRIQRGVDGYVRFLRLSFLDFFPAILTGGFALAAALSKQPGIALAMVGVAPISVGLTVWQLMSQKGVRLKLLRTREAMDGTVVEQLTGIDYVRAANTHAREIGRVDRTAEDRRAREVRHHFAMSLFGCGKALNEAFFHLLVVAIAIRMCVAGSISYGDILTFSVLFLNVMSPLNEIHRFIDEGHESSLRVGDLLHMLAEPEDRSFGTVEVVRPHLGDLAPLFECEGLRVDYRSADGRLKRALDGVSLTIHHGETIGVAGRSGCGKSTWLRVMMRLTHPSSGLVRLGGVPLDLVSRQSLGDLIGYVGQNPFVFAGTITDNIAYGVDDADAAAVERAARMACIHDEILDMPGGYRARVSERGQNLSGGQRQRLALARVFLKNPPILILDEGTSALDNISERSVQQAILGARADRTVILVAHRLSTLLDADRILVFDEGRVVESGTYDDLVGLCGTFAELVRSAEVGAGVEAEEAEATEFEPEPLEAMAVGV